MLAVYHIYKENISDPVFKVNLYSNLHLSFKPYLAFFFYDSQFKIILVHIILDLSAKPDG